ncbi:MAG: endonuclease III, partial [Candidatus Aenigmatarchaeota archaeon]
IGVLSQNTSDWNSTRAYIGLKRKVREITPENIANSDIDDLREAIKSGGLYNMKSERLQKLADYILQRYGDNLSKITQLSREEARKELLKMPGIGQKTADVFLSECLNYGTLAVDTHIFRVSKRMGFVPEDADYDEVKEVLERSISEDKRLRAHQLFIRLGRDYCKAKNPKCDECPLEEKCKKNIN